MRTDDFEKFLVASQASIQAYCMLRTIRHVLAYDDVERA